MKKKILIALATLLSMGSTSLVTEASATTDWTYLSAGSSSGKTLQTGYYYVTNDITFSNGDGRSGLTIAEGASVHIYIPQGVTLTARGGKGSGQTGAGAGIELPAGSSLYFEGSGQVKATGGDAANGGNGDGGSDAYLDYDNTILGGSGGRGGNGGGGAGAGIGTRGASGGSGGGGGQRTGSTGDEKTQYGVDGNSGGSGSTASSMGYLYVMPSVTLTATGGSAGNNGSGGSAGKTDNKKSILGTNFVGKNCHKPWNNVSKSTYFKKLREILSNLVGTMLE